MSQKIIYERFRGDPWNRDRADYHGGLGSNPRNFWSRYRPRGSATVGLAGLPAWTGVRCSRVTVDAEPMAMREASVPSATLTGHEIGAVLVQALRYGLYY